MMWKFCTSWRCYNTEKQAEEVGDFSGFMFMHKANCILTVSCCICWCWWCLFVLQSRFNMLSIFFYLLSNSAPAVFFWWYSFLLLLHNVSNRVAHKNRTFLRYHIFAATTDIIMQFLLNCSEITAENNKRQFLTSVKYSLQSNRKWTLSYLASSA